MPSKNPAIDFPQITLYTKRPPFTTLWRVSHE
nr:MAG TPA: hypothetical protein [Caudoviricetes sp.]